MKLSFDPQPYTFKGEKPFSRSQMPTKIKPLYQDKGHYKDMLGEFHDEIDELQNMMYAHNRYGLLLIFQAMDAAGKDGTIKHVMSGVNPHGVEIHSFKKPSENELDRDFLWRTSRWMPRRGHIGIFNRSYYEEVLVVKVHPKIVTNYQRIPKEYIQDLDGLFQKRYEDIANFELYAHRQGFRILKFFLNISKEEQRQRFLSRIDEHAKNWKFSEADIKERGYWDNYMEAYEAAINATSNPFAPWHVIPADDKKNMRLMVSQIILTELHNMDMHYPRVSDKRRVELQKYRKMLEEER